jgi:hypothetical protein
MEVDGCPFCGTPIAASEGAVFTIAGMVHARCFVARTTAPSGRLGAGSLGAPLLDTPDSPGSSTVR